jgi:hypothetical protein
MKKNSVQVSRTKIFIVIAVIALVGGGYFAYQQYNSLKKENQRLSNPQEAAKLESERIQKAISALIEVPNDEEPTIATVTDPSKLGNQDFFKNAQKDDRVIIYAKAKKAILYRPSTGKIIEVAPLNIGDAQNAANGQQTQQPAATTPATEAPAQ